MLIAARKITIECRNGKRIQFKKGDFVHLERTKDNDIIIRKSFLVQENKKSKVIEHSFLITNHDVFTALMDSVMVVGKEINYAQPTFVEMTTTDAILKEGIDVNVVSRYVASDTFFKEKFVDGKARFPAYDIVGKMTAREKVNYCKSLPLTKLDESKSIMAIKLIASGTSAFESKILIDTRIVEGKKTMSDKAKLEYVKSVIRNKMKEGKLNVKKEGLVPVKNTA